jgi:hypothetical protein
MQKKLSEMDFIIINYKLFVGTYITCLKGFDAGYP